MYAESIRPAFENIRQFTAHIEKLIPDDEWPLPKSRELLYIL